MKRKSTDRMSRIVGLAPDTGDGHVRVTEGDGFHVWLGSENTHAALNAWCERINAALKREGRTLDDLTEAEFMDFVSRLNDAGPS